jgi:DNA-binding NarL/FixJ family response regulator
MDEISARSGGAATVLLADDHVATRAGVRAALEVNGFCVVAEVDGADDAVAAALVTEPHICLLASHLPGGCVSAIERISAALPTTKIVMLTASESSFELMSALLAGADGYVPKTVGADRLRVTLRALLLGEVAVPRVLTAHLVDELRRRKRVRNNVGASSSVVLTQREQEVLALMRVGMSTAAIADRLCISPITVRRHISTSLQKLGERNRSSAVKSLAGDGHG